MSAARRFTVLTTGEVESGFDETQVALDFVSLIHTTPERAVAFIHTEQQLVADVDEERALAYQKKLASIGMRIRVIDSEELAAANEAEIQQQALDSGALSLQPEYRPSDDEFDDIAANEELIGEINLIPTPKKKYVQIHELAQNDTEHDSQSDEPTLSSADLNLPDDEDEDSTFLAEEPDQEQTDFNSQALEPAQLDAELSSQIDELAQIHTDEPAQDFSDLSSAADESAQDFSDLSPSADEPLQDFSDLSPSADEPLQDFSDLSSAANEPVQELSNLSSAAEEPAQDFSDLSSAAEEPAQDFSDLSSPANEPDQELSDLSSPASEPVQELSDLSSPANEPVQELSDLSSAADEPVQDFSALISAAERSVQNSSHSSQVAANESILPAQTIEPQNVTLLDTTKDEEAIINSIRQTGNTLESSKPSTSVLSLRNRPVRLCILGVFAAAASALLFITNPINTFSDSVSTASKYSYTSTASEDMNKLMNVSGMHGNINLFTASLPAQFRTYLSNNESNNSALPQKSHQELMELIPRAYNEEALHSTVASWLQRNTFEDDVPKIIEAFDAPKVQEFMELKHSKNRISDLPGFMEFKESLVNNPTSGERNRALTSLLDALILDKVDYEIGGDLQRAFITTRGAFEPDNESTASKEKVRNELKTMRDNFVYARPDIRRDALQELSWQLEEFSVEDILEVRGALDDSSVRELNRQMVKGYEEYLKQSTLWLQREL